MEYSGVCRCCLTEGLHKDMYRTYTFLNKKEIYSDMLLECFNMVVTPTPKAASVICDECINSLRQCLSFKQQVVMSDKEFFRKTFSESIGITDEDIKIKIEPLHNGSDSDDYFLADAVPNMQDTKIKIETNDSKKSIKKDLTIRKTKVSSKSKKTEEIQIETLISRLAKTNCKIKPVKATRKPIPIPTTKERPLTWFSPNFFPEKNKERNNAVNILKYSNILPFKDISLVGFLCSYCEKSFTDTPGLRKHTESEHAADRLKITRGDLTNSYIKVDITDLKCTICDTNMDSIELLKSHLSNDHKKLFYSDAKDNLMQFKLVSPGVYNCSMCPSTYETFKMLKQHMNIHYNNFSCSICEAPFASKRSLNAHKHTHVEGAHKCEYCEKVFATRYKMLSHIKKLHLGEKNIANCPYCKQVFSSYYQRNQHLIKVHNSEARYKCKVCDRSFILKSLLMRHIKKNHLMERDAQCTECGYRFFCKKALKAHMVKHTGEKNYACDVCNKAYARKYTLREHMRIHNNDRRFKCDLCGLAFVQKCSLKSHLLSNHGVSVAASEISTIENT